MEVEMEFAGRLKKIRIKLIMIGICLIFLGGYSLIQEWKDQKKNTTKKVSRKYMDYMHLGDIRIQRKYINK